MLDLRWIVYTLFWVSTIPGEVHPRILVLAEDAERAKQLLLELEARERKKREEAGTGPPIEVVCEECGCRASFPAGKRGSVEECPQCGVYLDIGDDDVPGDWEEGEAPLE
jgi:hypothetical protein